MNTFFCYKIWIWAMFVFNYYIVFCYIYFEICVTTFNNPFFKLVLHKFWIIISYRIMNPSMECTHCNLFKNNKFNVFLVYILLMYMYMWSNLGSNKTFNLRLKLKKINNYYACFLLTNNWKHAQSYNGLYHVT
jgi:hypothetical protein